MRKIKFAKQLVILSRLAVVGFAACSDPEVDLGTTEGSTGFGGISVNVPVFGDIGIPKGSFSHLILYHIGDGTFIQGQSASFISPGGQICNFQIDWLYYGTNGGEPYWVELGPVNQGCFSSGKRGADGWPGGLPPTRRSAGQICSTLRTNGEEIARVCNSVTP